MPVTPYRLGDKVTSMVDGFSIIGYNPNGLHYRLVREEGATYEHPDDSEGSPTPVVGVHKVISTSPWESNVLGDEAGALCWHEVALSAWTGTRRDFAAADESEKKEALAIGPAFAGSKGGDSLGGYSHCDIPRW